MNDYIDKKLVVKIKLNTKMGDEMSLELEKLKSILEDGDFYSDVSEVASAALQGSINLKNRYKKSHRSKVKEVELDFSVVNRAAIEKRGNLKVYQNLPKGIRVVAK